MSTDTLDSHREFAAKNGINFPLVADPDERIAALYGVDTTLGHAHRTTFVIGRDGRIAHTFSPVQVDGHEAAVLAVLRASRK